MSTKSRLGKGLGALFPTLPSEEALADSQKMEAETAKKAAISRERADSIVSHRSMNHVKQAKVSRETIDMSDAIPSSREKIRKRSAMPSLGDVSSPIDFFFGDDRSQSVSRSFHNADNKTTDSDEKKEELKPVQGGYLDYLKPSDIVPNAHQPRTVFDDQELQELADSIKEVGVLQPIVVRRIHQTHDERAQYELIMGERRWRASQLAGLTTVPAIVRTTSDEFMLRDALLENLHRVALNPLEEAAAYAQMIDEFGLTQAQLSKSVSKSRPQIANTLRLLNLPASVQKKVSSGLISSGHARALLGLDSAEAMEKLAQRILDEGLSVRSVEEIVSMQSSQREPGTRSRVQRNDRWGASPIRKQLEHHFSTKVSIKGTPQHGRIEIVFTSPEEMDRIVQLLVPSQQG